MCRFPTRNPAPTGTAAACPAAPDKGKKIWPEKRFSSSTGAVPPSTPSPPSPWAPSCGRSTRRPMSPSPWASPRQESGWSSDRTRRSGPSPICPSSPPTRTVAPSSSICPSMATVSTSASPARRLPTTRPRDVRRARRPPTVLSGSAISTRSSRCSTASAARTVPCRVCSRRSASPTWAAGSSPRPSASTNRSPRWCSRTPVFPSSRA